MTPVEGSFNVTDYAVAYALAIDGDGECPLTCEGLAACAASAAIVLSNHTHSNFAYVYGRASAQMREAMTAALPGTEA
jgi:hypothetical protein